MKTYLEREEIEQLERAASNLRDRLLVRLLAHTGCRVSEALGIAVDDIDFDENTITIEHLKTRLNLACPGCGARLGRNHVFCPECGIQVEAAVTQQKEHRRMRTLPVDAGTMQMLGEYIKRGGPVARGGRRLLFGISRNQAWRVIRNCADRAGLGPMRNPETGKVHGISPHKLRDAFAVMAVKHNDSGDSLRMLQQHLGHSSFDTTARYRKVAGEEHREWYDKLWGKVEDSDDITS